MIPRICISLLCAAIPFSIQADSLPWVPAPHLVELFTSQGCSSCPPAEILLNTWGMSQFKKGLALPLAFHVDYWNYLGWNDPFSSPVFSSRQKTYSETLGDSIYTPQMVVDGRASFVGSDSNKAFEAASHPSPDYFSTRMSLENPTQDGRIPLEISVTCGDLKPLVGSWDLWIVLFENHLKTRVLSGENNGKDLEENFIVRRLIKAGLLKTPGNLPKELKTTILWDPEWDKNNGGIGIFLQNRSTLETTGVRWIYPIREEKKGAERGDES